MQGSRGEGALPHKRVAKICLGSLEIFESLLNTKVGMHWFTLSEVG